MGGFLLPKIKTPERRMPLKNQTRETNTFTKKIGGATYHVRIHFNEKSKDGFHEKLLRFIKKELVENRKTC